MQTATFNIFNRAVSREIAPPPIAIFSNGAISLPTNSVPQGTSADNTAAVEQAVRAVDEALQPLGITLEFSRDQDTHAVVIKVKDQISGDVLRQIPSEAMLHLSATLGNLRGKLFDRTV